MMPDMQGLLQQAQQMQQQYATAQAELAALKVEGSAGGGLVKAVVTGDNTLVSVKIDPSVVDAEDVETLEDLVVAAIHAAGDEARKAAEAKLGPLTQGLGGLGDSLGLPGFQ